MIKIYDKAKWHIDGGEDSKEVISRFQEMFVFLDTHGLLTAEGKEMLDIGIDSEISLTERMLTEEGNLLIEKYIDKLLEISPKDINNALTKMINS